MTPRLAALTGDADIRALFDDAAEIADALAFERALAEAEAEAGLIAPAAAVAIATACAAFRPDVADLIAGFVRDGVLGPRFVAQLRATLPPEHRAALHLGATSQDIVDTALVLRLARLCDLLDARLAAVIAALETLRRRQGGVVFMAHTRMQEALPIQVADKLDTWLRPIERHRARLAAIRPRLLVVQLGGPVGTRGDLGAAAPAIVAGLARRLGLAAADPWHSARDGIVEFGGWLALVAGTLGKIGADIALLAQTEIGAVRLAETGGSSAMAHKANPVAAEVLLALARFAAGLAGTLYQTMPHENERSGAAWTLEWLTLPPLAEATGAALAHALRLIAGLRFTGGGDDAATPSDPNWRTPQRQGGG